MSKIPYVRGTPAMPENYRKVAQVHLRRVARAARKSKAARAELREAILEARESSETYADIGKAAGLTHARIVQIVKEAKDA